MSIIGPNIVDESEESYDRQDQGWTPSSTSNEVLSEKDHFEGEMLGRQKPITNLVLLVCLLESRQNNLKCDNAFVRCLYHNNDPVNAMIVPII